MKKQAFTLIELLVVIAIIAILAAILFPVFAQAKAAAKKAVCLSNMKQIALGVTMYTTDSDDYYPQSEYGGGGATGNPDHLTWTTSIMPYIKNGDTAMDSAGNQVTTGKSGLWHCPEAPNRNPNDYTVEGYTYGVNHAIFADNYGSGNSWFDSANQAAPSLNETSIDSVADKIMVIEKGENYSNWSYPWFHDWQAQWVGSITTVPGNEADIYRDGDDSANPNWAGYSVKFDTDCNANSDGAWECAAHARYRHNNAMNVSYLDGHAKTIIKGGLKWYKNIYIKRGDAAQYWTYQWYMTSTYPY